MPPPSVKYQPTEGAGYEDVEGLPTVDPEKPQYVQALQEGKAKSNIQGRLNSIWYGFHSFKPEFMMSDADLALEDRQDAVQDWISSNDAYVFFKENPKELPKFEANPIEYYETNIKK